MDSELGIFIISIIVIITILICLIPTIALVYFGLKKYRLTKQMKEIAEEANIRYPIWVDDDEKDDMPYIMSYAIIHNRPDMWRVCEEYDNTTTWIVFLVVWHVLELVVMLIL